jgi:kynureninase
LRAKSLRLTELLIDLADELLCGRGVSLITPRDEPRRGGHIALAHPQAERLFSELSKRKVVTDYRRPNILRFAPSPLYTSFEECFEAIQRLASIIDACA